jgi:hypothetical protein
MSNFSFFKDCIFVELRQSRGYQIVSTLYLLINGAITVLWFATTRTPAQFLVSWTREEKFILLLISLCGGLIISLIGTIDGARRFHTRKIKEQNGRFEKLDIGWRNNERDIIKFSSLSGIGKQLTVKKLFDELNEHHNDALKLILESWRLDIENQTGRTVPNLPALSSQGRQWITDRINELRELIPKPPIAHN